MIHYVNRRSCNIKVIRLIKAIVYGQLLTLSTMEQVSMYVFLFSSIPLGSENV